MGALWFDKDYHLTLASAGVSVPCDLLSANLCVLMGNKDNEPSGAELGEDQERADRASLVARW